MKHRKLALTFGALTLAAASFTTNADILFANLGTAAPPTTIGGHTLTPFDLSAQNAIPHGSIVSSIPGNPSPGTLGIAPSITKWETSYWNSPWGHGYSGPIFFDSPAPNTTTFTLTLPPNTQGFYFYAVSRVYGVSEITATTDSGTNSGVVTVTTNYPAGPDSANGFAFYSTAGENITSITISSTQGVALAEFGISTTTPTTCASESYTGTKLTWCQNICENGYTGNTLDMWLRRWINRYHDMPYCTLEEEEQPPQEQPPV